MQASVVFVGVPDRLRHAMLGPTLEAGLLWRSHGAHEGGRPPTDVDVVVVGPECEDPVDAAQRWFRADRRLAVLLMVEKDRFAAVEAQLATAPYVGKTVRVVSTEDTEAFAQIVALARQHKKHRRQVEQANRLLDRVNELV